MALRAHEHFCWLCYGRRTKETTSGWWRCTVLKCTRPMKGYCRVHTEAGKADPAVDPHVSAEGAADTGNPSTRVQKA